MKSSDVFSIPLSFLFKISTMFQLLRIYIYVYQRSMLYDRNILYHHSFGLFSKGVAISKTGFRWVAVKKLKHCTKLKLVLSFVRLIKYTLWV